LSDEQSSTKITPVFIGLILNRLFLR
jgi:hypothetical protein